jgi:hypothetical protein
MSFIQEGYMAASFYTLDREYQRTSECFSIDDLIQNCEGEHCIAVAHSHYRSRRDVTHI